MAQQTDGSAWGPLPHLSGRVVAVTGASRGIGLALVELLQAAGATVLAGAREATDSGLPGVLSMTLDVSDESSVEAFAQRAASLGVDTLVNNAGVGTFGSIESTTADAYRRVFDTNVLGTLLVTRHFLPEFQRRHAQGRPGQVVNITSDVSARSFAGGSIYAASKHAQRALTQVTAREGQACGLRVTEIRPGVTDTHFNAQTPGHPERADHLRPADVARAVLFALSAPAHVRVDELVLHPVVQAVDY